MLNLVLAVLTLSVAAYAQAKPVQIAPGQSVYVVAMKSNGNPDLAIEQKLKEEFEKQKAFKLATSLSSADFVFLMLIEYEYNQAIVAGIGMGSEDIKSATTFAVPVDTYKQSKTDLDALRDQALWQHAENNGMWRTSGLPKKIAKQFHEQFKKR